MARNRVYETGKYRSLTASHPTTPLSGQPCRIGSITAVATTDKRSNGTTSVDLGPAVYQLKVKGVDDNGNSAVAVGDPLYYVDADVNDGTGFLSKKSSGYFFGYAMKAVGSGSTDAAADVLIVPASALGSGLTANSLGGAQVANGADNNVVGAIPVLHRVVIVAGALGNTDVVLTHKTRVVDAWLVLTGAGVATTTLQVKNGATAITDAMAASGAAKALVRAATIDSAQHEIAAGGTLRVTSATGATQPDAIVYVLGERVA